MALTDEDLNDAVTKLIDDGHRVLLKPDAAARLDPASFEIGKKGRDNLTGGGRGHWVCETVNKKRECYWDDGMGVIPEPPKPLIGG